MNILKYALYFPVWISHNMLGINLYFYLLAPLAGLFYFLRNLKVSKAFLFLSGVFFINSLFYIGSSSYGMAIRSLLPILLFLVPLFLQKYLDKKDWLRISKGALFLFLIFYIFEYFIGSDLRPKQVLPGFFLPRLEGFTGYSNFTGYTLSIMGMYFLLTKKYYLFYASFFLQLLSLSRTSYLITVLMFVGIGLNYLVPKIKKNISTSVFVLIICSPLLLVLMESLASESLKMKLVFFSGGRYPIQLSFLEMFLDNPFGVGYQSSHSLFHAYRNLGSSIVENGTHIITFKDIDAHSTFIQLLVEFGIIGYGVLCFTFFKLFQMATRHSFLNGWMLNCALFGQLFLYGLNEFYFYFLLAVCIPDLSEEQNTFNFSDKIRSIFFSSKSS